LYKLQGEPVQALVHDNDSVCGLWHKRMGHLHHRVFHILKEIVTGLLEFSVEQNSVCKWCMFGKHAKVAFPSNEHRSKGILNLVHSDVCGLMSVASIIGSMYYVSCVDDFSHKTWIYFLKTKDEVFSMFQEFKALVENHTRQKM
jgi:hypothetical protein